MNPRVVAASFDEPESLEPVQKASGGRDFRRLTSLLEQPVQAARWSTTLPVYHVAVRLAPQDREITDHEFAVVAGELMAAVGLTPHGDDEGVRWVAVRHADDHIHIVATLARQDGQRPSLSNSRRKLRAACVDLEKRLQLRATAPSRWRVASRPKRGEIARAARAGRGETHRDELRRLVRQAAAGAGSVEEYFSRLQSAGVVVRPRNSTNSPKQTIGYAVSLPGHKTAGGELIWYSGGTLAPHLTLPRLVKSKGWQSARLDVVGTSRRSSVQERADSYSAATRAVDAVCGHVRVGDRRALGAAGAAGDVLMTVARAIEGRRGGVLSAAAELFATATCEDGGRMGSDSPHARALRRFGRVLAASGRLGGGSDFVAALDLVRALNNLAQALTVMRCAQGRQHQAQVATGAAEMLTGFTQAGAESVSTDLVVEAGEAVVPALTTERSSRHTP